MFRSTEFWAVNSNAVKGKIQSSHRKYQEDKKCLATRNKKTRICSEKFTIRKEKAT